ncbi:AAA family ATPase [Brevundimonas sp.]|uniref:AAA family ATPase n=1 Tax=Brevundimonas sp. TaxID=1871086 RepID=UPI0025C511FA|nr:AAA family ATPase [Brevundimonas sp.]
MLKRTAGRGRRIELTGGSFEVADTTPGRGDSTTDKVSVQPSSSGLAILRRLGKQYDAGQVEELAEIFEDLRLFEVDVEAVRKPTSTEEAWRLRPDASNLAAFLLWMRGESSHSFDTLCEDVKYVLPGFEGFVFTELGGSNNSIRLDIKEQHLEGTTPLARASFGTIRSIALFAMLHDPSPPKLTCLEEVDHGLHPYALDRLVDRLREASEKTQIIVATHSPALINRLTPEDLVVFERDERTGGTRIVDLKPGLVRKMQQNSGYGLGELWFSGSLGGVPS